MCGIAGVVLSGRADDRDLAVPLAAMTAAIHARGPDDRGVYVSPEGRVGLGNTRLAIQDLSQAGHMPMGNAARSVCITYNGEIYNADDLRIELQRLGFTFVSHSDTEVILHGYEAWGESVVQRLRGMFAFALYDLRGTPTLLL